jgi:5-methylcytosine-specific restriction endonuclease McrA
MEHAVVVDDRRRHNLGAPDGVERRDVTRVRRATDALKMACPFCGASESSVVKSRGSIATDQIRRRRECGECGERFPTYERIDHELLNQELAQRGLRLVIDNTRIN